LFYSGLQMSLSTVIQAGLVVPTRPTRALVLMGGGARTAYQVGVLKALGTMLAQHAGPNAAFPFQVVVGTSAGALNAAYLAGAGMRSIN
jgi:NTE family protein